jgi:hypothetical protein
MRRENKTESNSGADSGRQTYPHQIQFAAAFAVESPIGMVAYDGQITAH